MATRKQRLQHGQQGQNHPYVFSPHGSSGNGTHKMHHMSHNHSGTLLSHLQQFPSYPHAPQIAPLPQMTPMPQMPMTPLDFSYSQLMLPSNLLATPTPYGKSHHFLPPQPPLPLYKSMPARPPQFRKAFLLPILAHTGKARPASNNLEHLSFSRSIILNNLDPKVTLTDILNHISFGPVESCRLLSNQLQQFCILSFINSKASYALHRHFKLANNMQNLKDVLHQSQSLEVLQMDSPQAQELLNAHGIDRQDYIPSKTLNYIMEFHATRAIMMTFEIIDLDLVPLMEKALQKRCARFGPIEHFVSSVNEDELEMDFVVHFTSIDIAIQVYEYFSKKIGSDSQSASDLLDDIVQLVCLHVEFHRDRCDRNITARKPRRSVAQENFDSPQPASLPSAIGSKLTVLVQSEKSVSRSDSPGSRISESQSDLKSMNIRSDSKSLGHEVVPPETGATSDFSDSHIKQNASFRTQQPFGEDLEFGSLESGPLLTPDPFEHPMINSIYAGFDSDSYNYPQNVPYPVGQAPYKSPYPASQDSINSCNRTIYLGNIHPKTTVEEIANNVRAGGLVESIRYHRAKRMCFITFVDPAVALKFYLNYQVLHQLIIREQELVVGWGKNHSGPLSPAIAMAVQSGASRNVYIGLKLGRHTTEKIRIPDEATLREDFSKFGDLEQINFYNNKDCGFMNFMNIADAIEVVTCFETRNEARVRSIVRDNGEFYEKYLQFKISYGKDRCGNPLKFSFRKRDTEEDYEVPPPASEDVGNDTFNKEAALVFGIRTNEQEATAIEQPLALEKGDAAPGDILLDVAAGAAGHAAPVDEVEKQIAKHKEEANGAAHVGDNVPAHDETKGNGKVPDDDNDNDNDDNDDDDDDDDDISIVIESEKGPVPPLRVRRKPQKVYHHHLDLLDLLGATWAATHSSPMLGGYGNGMVPGGMYFQPQHLAMTPTMTPAMTPLMTPTMAPAMVPGMAPMRSVKSYTEGSRRSLHTLYHYGPRQLRNGSQVGDFRAKLHEHLQPDERRRGERKGRDKKAAQNAM